MTGLLTSEKLVAAIAGGVALAVLAGVAIWSRPMPARAVPLWALVSVVLLALAAWPVWAGLRPGGREAGAQPGGGSPPTPPPAARCAPRGTELEETARGIAFARSCLAAPARTPFTIRFSNRDRDIPHNVHICTADPAVDPGARSLFGGEIITGVQDVTYEVGPLPPGTYFFHCDVHPAQMRGTFVVE